MMFNNFLLFRKSDFKAFVRRILMLVLAVPILTGCSSLWKTSPSPAPSPPSYKINGKTYYPLDKSHGFIEEGIASWYGDDFHGKKTANGEIYNMYAMTAAHKTLPLGTMVEVVNLENQKKVVVRINDRGPYVGDRIIDLSYEAASQIGMVRNGTAKVKITALETDDAFLKNAKSDIYYTGDFTIQAGAFSQKGNAERLKETLEHYVKKVDIVPFDNKGTIFYRVRAGEYTSLKKAKKTEQHLIENGFPEAFVVSKD